MKTCIRCNSEKLFKEFHKYSKGKDGYKNTCKSCRSLENKTVLKDKLKNKNLMGNYGITLAEYNKMLKNQEHCCKICGVHENHCQRGLFVDHCHETGKVRGLLCTHCNMGLGHFKDRKEFLLSAIKYLEKEIAGY